jgi:hypothetical protein
MAENSDFDKDFDKEFEEDSKKLFSDRAVFLKYRHKLTGELLGLKLEDEAPEIPPEELAIPPDPLEIRQFMMEAFIVLANKLAQNGKLHILEELLLKYGKLSNDDDDNDNVDDDDDDDDDDYYDLRNRLQ